MERPEHRDDDMLTKVELGAALNMSTRTIDRWLANGTGRRASGFLAAGSAGAGVTSASGLSSAAPATRRPSSSGHGGATLRPHDIENRCETSRTDEQ